MLTFRSTNQILSRIEYVYHFIIRRIRNENEYTHDYSVTFAMWM